MYRLFRLPIRLACSVPLVGLHAAHFHVEPSQRFADIDVDSGSWLLLLFLLFRIHLWNRDLIYGSAKVSKTVGRRMDAANVQCIYLSSFRLAATSADKAARDNENHGPVGGGIGVGRRNIPTCTATVTYTTPSKDIPRVRQSGRLPPDRIVGLYSVEFRDGWKYGFW